ncbi:invasion protein regulator [Pirellulimonas nuda]|uniref:Invasion protein regulator n=1 Tax=Pirellulimonas nuda TaxID=2528009 RepID=A0A518D844_9BACT|nr:tetratricopeptide repeat protein [Pirellulimonas nuda]QDU87656.1 invasion protein regulator [Pirellulimonas nuda]
MPHADNPHLTRAQMLLGRRMVAEAQRELGQALAQQPDSAEAHALLAICRAQQKAYDDATELSQRAVGLAPDSAPIRYLAAQVALMRNDLPVAQCLATEAIELNPHDADYFALRAQVSVARSAWREAMVDLKFALQLEPDNALALNLLSVAQRGVGDTTAGRQTLTEALRRDPENAWSHANLGWSHLERGELKDAERHFREAIRLEPSLESARQGVLETVKAKAPPYRWWLSYLFWMSRQTPQVQMGVLFGLWIGARMVGGAADRWPKAAPVLYGVLVLYGLFCLTTWIARPLSNAALLLHPFGRLALRPKEKLEAVVVVGWLAVGIGIGVAAAVTNSHVYASIAIALLLTWVPATMAFKFEHPKPLRIMIGVTALVAVLSVSVMSVELLGPDRAPQVLPAAFLNGVYAPAVKLLPYSPLAVLLLANALAANRWRD